MGARIKAQNVCYEGKPLYYNCFAILSGKNCRLFILMGSWRDREKYKESVSTQKVWLSNLRLGFFFLTCCFNFHSQIDVVVLCFFS
jgi:hypothetical protein